MNLANFGLGSTLSMDQIQNSVFKWTALDEKSQAVVADVYAKLTAGCLVAAIGAYLGMAYAVDGILPLLAGMFCIYKLNSTPNTESNHPYRVGYFFGACALYGLSLSGFIYIHYRMDPSIILNASVMTVLLFGSFSVAALTARRREYLYLGGTLMTATTGLMWAGLANLFFRSPLMNTLRVYAGLLVFTLWVLVDTQVMLERIERGCTDSLKHAMELFTDLVNIFIHVVRVLSENNNRKKRERN